MSYPPVPDGNSRAPGKSSEGGASRSNAASGSGPGGRASDEDIAAEIADHLAASASELVRRGQSEGEATNAALARFGNVARIKRQCWWIHHGEEIMFRTAGMIVLCLFAVGMGAMTYANWQFQRSLASRNDELAYQLASLLQNQQTMLAQQRPPEITGSCYLGDRSAPAKNVEMELVQFSEEKSMVVRLVRTDEMGRFTTGFIQPGHYSLVAPVIAPQGVTNDQLLFTRLQSQPLYLISGVDKPDIELNLAPSAHIQFEAKGIPSSLTVLGKGMRIRWSVYVTPLDEAGRPSMRQTRNPFVVSPRDGWPVPLLPAEHSNDNHGMEFPHDYWLPPRNYSVYISPIFAWEDDEFFPIGQGYVWNSAGGSYGFGGGGGSVGYERLSMNIQLLPRSSVLFNVAIEGGSLEERFAAALKEEQAAIAASPEESRASLEKQMAYAVAKRAWDGIKLVGDVKPMDDIDHGLK